MTLGTVAQRRRRPTVGPFGSLGFGQATDTEEAAMAATARKGDRISIDSQKAGEPGRQGTILNVIEHDYGTSFEVAWDDGHTSTFRPTAGTVHTVRPAKSKR
jgi:hypothetical protein